MKCFNHRDREAIAICKHCGKGLCDECLIESHGTVSCAGPCAKQVARQLYMVEKSILSYRVTGWAIQASAVVFLLLAPVAGLLGALIALDPRVKTSEGFTMMMEAFAVAGICLILALACYGLGKRLTRKSKYADALFASAPSRTRRTG
jgi:hypothetical protein